MMLLWYFVFFGLVTAQDEIPITMVTSQPVNAESVNPYPEYYCYLSSSDADATVTTRRVWETRTNGANSPSNNPAPPSPQLVSDNSFPAGSAVYRVSLSFNSNNQSYAFGTFSCEASKAGRKTTKVSNILMNSDGTAFPADGLVTQTVNEGDTGVEIRMSGGSSVKTWYRNGGIVPVQMFTASGGTLLIRNGVQKNLHEGVYEAVTNFTTMPRVEPKHGLKRLIVRSCSANHWGPPDCAGICDNCYNGGVCDDDTGRCICPPGFMGTNCLTACGGHRFGYSCEFQCSYYGDDEDSCSGLQFCLLDPFGCRCNTGWTNLSCDTACSAGTFGASCLQDCHCNGDCNRFTGLCNGTCEAGWTGDSCQIPSVCSPGYYGSNCTDKCYCKDNQPCNKITGACPGNQCTPGYRVYAGSPICQECQGDLFGESCNQVCRCDADACNKVTGDCSGQCKPQWVDSYQCLAGLQDANSSKINPNAVSAIICTTQISSNSATILTVNASRQIDLVVNRGIEFVNRTRMGNTEVWRFTADNVREGDELFCLVQDQGGTIVARLSTTVMEYDLPVLMFPPVVINGSASSVTIRWRAWDPDMDDGDPPLVAYIPYYRETASEEWVSGPMVSSDETLEFLADNLVADTRYSFSVAAVREGERGEGDLSPSVTGRTNCSVSDYIPVSVTAWENKTAMQVNVSWQLPDVAVCSTGISFAVLYERSGDSGSRQQLVLEDDVNSSWVIVNTQDLIGNGNGGTFSFCVLVQVESGKAKSPWSNQINITDDEGVSSAVVAIIVVIAVLLPVIGVSVPLVTFAVRLRKRDQTLPRPPSVEGVYYENTGILSGPYDYAGVDQNGIKMESLEYEEVNNQTSADDSVYEPVAYPHKHKENNINSKVTGVNPYHVVSLQTLRRKLRDVKMSKSPVKTEDQKIAAAGRAPNKSKDDVPDYENVRKNVRKNVCKNVHKR